VNQHYSFSQWLSNIRRGDPSASSQLVELYTPVLRRVIRARLIHRRTGCLIDPLDVCQIVFGSFFARVADSWPRVESMDQLTALMIAMARNSVRDELRRHTAIRRDHRRRVASDRSRLQLHQLEARGLSPCEVIDYLELRDLVLRHLTFDEWSLLEDRLSGRSWESIAVERGNPAVVLRKKLNRAVQRVRILLAVSVSRTRPLL
jgi:DNA-directed RNA polymerase specialized sigma24 family protein